MNIITSSELQPKPIYNMDSTTWYMHWLLYTMLHSPVQSQMVVFTSGHHPVKGHLRHWKKRKKSVHLFSLAQHPSVAPFVQICFQNLSYYLDLSKVWNFIHIKYSLNEMPTRLVKL